MAASTALPPWRRTRIAVSAASGWGATAISRLKDATAVAGLGMGGAYGGLVVVVGREGRVLALFRGGGFARC